MIAALLALAAAQAAVPADPATPSDDIVVLARKLTQVRWTYAVRTDGSVKHCSVKRSSGDTEVDGLVCEATRQCGAEFSGAAAPVTACLRPRALALVERLKERRSATGPETVLAAR
ncbi:hypothetical protein [Sphingomonas aracearum]|uniref:TonB C-terminal domain-containing protein n=1 Tax=Sphingomonas aracearum TaxID=2283317 RepID=A0A369VY88_9SPHN|nr:hypothetical protein [Sphingomonas aracearum]RDE07093.1 hypothetical protein DVW87_05405 [Sphingomonas aracearum]